MLFTIHPKFLYSASGTMLFWSYCREARTSSPLLNKTGRYSLRTTIPARYLNEGSYRIELVSCIHNQRWLLEPGTGMPIYFEISEGFKNVIFTPKFDWFEAPQKA